MSTAQQVHDEFRGSRVTVSVNAVAEKHGAGRLDVDRCRHWVFPDGSVLIAQGKGRSLKLTVRP